MSTNFLAGVGATSVTQEEGNKFPLEKGTAILHQEMSDYGYPINKWGSCLKGKNLLAFPQVPIEVKLFLMHFLRFLQ